MQECFLLIGRVVVTGFEIEDAGVDGCTFQPVGNTQYGIIITTDIVVIVHWVDGFHCFQKTLQCFLLSARRDTIIEIFQEVRLT